MLNAVLAAVGALLIGLIAGYVIRVVHAKTLLGSAEESAKRIIADAKREAEAKKKEGE